MNRLMEKMVRLGLVMAWRLAGSPTRTSPLSVKATTLGVRRFPSWLAMTLTSFPSMTATTELVVPRSMPMIFSSAIAVLLFCTGGAASLDDQPQRLCRAGKGRAGWGGGPPHRPPRQAVGRGEHRGPAPAAAGRGRHFVGPAPGVGHSDAPAAGPGAMTNSQ